jgi:hypothetical protein
VKYILEIYYQGECIERREQEDAFIPPATGEQIYVEFQNPSYPEEYGNCWIVKKRRHLMFASSLKTQMQTLMLYCEPDPEKGQ